MSEIRPAGVSDDPVRLIGSADGPVDAEVLSRLLRDAREDGAPAVVVVVLAQSERALAEALLDHMGPRPASGPAALPASPPPCSLTARETEVLRELAEGHTNAGIARHLWLSDQTVKFHLSNIYRKLGVSNRTAASRYALVNGLAGSVARSAP
jgi:DNA-binding NarL/FixJ family response regulator